MDSIRELLKNIYLNVTNVYKKYQKSNYIIVSNVTKDGDNQRQNESRRPYLLNISHISQNSLPVEYLL